MASKKISELNSASALTGAELFLIVQSGDNRKLTLDSLLGGLTCSNSVNPTLTLTTNSFIVKASGGNATNGAFRISGSGSNLPSLTLSNVGATKFTFQIGDLATVGGTSLALVETWNSSSVIHTALDLNITNTLSNASSRLLSLRVGSTPVASVDVSGNVFHNFHYPKFVSLGFVGTTGGITNNTQIITISANTALNTTQLAVNSLIQLNMSGGAWNVTLPSMTAGDSGKVFTFIMNVSSANTMSIEPANSGERGSLYYKARTAAVAGLYMTQWAWAYADGNGKWIPVASAGAATSSSGSTAAPTQGITFTNA
jgi:hypothetical protein